MQQLLLCYRQEGAQTAKLFSFYMQRNHPEIPVWYSNGRPEGNYMLDVKKLVRDSYGVVIFLTKNFTRGFLDKNGNINENHTPEKPKEECVTVQEIIEIERNLQTRKDFELHIIHLNGAKLTLENQQVLATVFKQAGILTKDSVAHFSQHNRNPFDTASDNEDTFFDRMIASYLPHSAQHITRGNFSIGNYATTVDIICWDCNQMIPPENITFELDAHRIPMYDQLEREYQRSKPLEHDDDVVSLVWYDMHLTTNDERKKIRIGFQISKYHLFKKALELWDINGFNMSREIASFLNTKDTDRIYPIPNSMGMVFMVVTADQKLIFGRRGYTTEVRTRQFDCSIVEGMLVEVDKTIRRQKMAYSYLDDDYIVRECKRAFCEEICVDDHLQAQIFGLILDKKYGQWNLTGIIHSSLTAEQIQATHYLRDDTTELNQLFFVDYLRADGTRKIDDIKAAITLYRKDGFWDTALVTLYGTLCVLGFTQEEIDSLY